MMPCVRLFNLIHKYLATGEEGAYADVLLVEANLLGDVTLMANPHKNFKIIMKDGVIYKNTIR